MKNLKEARSKGTGRRTETGFEAGSERTSQQMMAKSISIKSPTAYTPAIVCRRLSVLPREILSAVAVATDGVPIPTGCFVRNTTAAEKSAEDVVGGQL